MMRMAILQHIFNNTLPLQFSYKSSPFLLWSGHTNVSDQSLFSFATFPNYTKINWLLTFQPLLLSLHGIYYFENILLCDERLLPLISVVSCRFPVLKAWGSLYYTLCTVLQIYSHNNAVWKRPLPRNYIIHQRVLKTKKSETK